MIERRIIPYRDALPKGVKVVTVEAPHLHSALLAVYVRAGSRHEEPRVMGVSHFLEHMFFRGSARYRDTVAMNALVEAAGGNLNGVTCRDHGYYYTPLHPDAIEVGFDVLGDILRAPRLSDIETERKVILEEMNDELDAEGRDIDLDNLSKMAVFPGHGLSHKIAGTRRTVKRIARADLVEHHRRMYCAGNVVVACVGRVTRERVLALAAKHFDWLSPGPCTKDVPPDLASEGPSLHLTESEDSPQTELRMNFPAPPEAHPDFPALSIARRVLDDGLSSRLPFEIVERRGLAYDVRAELDTFSDVSVFEVEAATAHANVPEVIREAAAVLRKLCLRGPTPDELERAKRRHRIGLEFSMDSCSDLAGWFGGTELWRPAESYEERAARLDAVDADAVRRVCARVFSRRNLRLVVVGRAGARTAARLKGLAADLPLPD